MFGKRRFGHAGQSIVEILVAMVVLLIGIFGIVRLFPTGFGIILYGESATQAQRLAQSALETARANAQNLPDGVVPIAPNGAVDAELSPGTEANDFTNPVPADARYYGFNRKRRIFGETTKIPPPTANVLYMPVDSRSGNRELVSIYTLRYGPLYSADIQPPGLGGLVVYSGTSLERVVFTNDPTADDLAQLTFQRFGVNYQRNLLFFAPRPYARRYKLVYSYIISDPKGPFRAQSRPDQFVDVPAGADRVAIPLPNGAALEPGEEQVFRAFNKIPLATPFSDRDPYEFKLLNSFVGIVGFNPLGTLVQRGGNSGPITAKVDYDVDDWHILSEERAIPQEAPNRVKLTLNFIKHAGDIQENQEPYTGLTADYPGRPGLTGIDLIVVDLDTGATIDSRTLQAEPGPQVSSANGAIDYRIGTIHFNPTVQWSLPPNGAPGPAESIGGKHVRIYYRTENDLGLQVEKAFTTYLRSNLLTTVTPGQYGQLPEGYLVFPASDHNQSVLIDYSFTRQVAPNVTRRLTVSGELQPIRDPNDPASPQVAFGNNPNIRPTDWFVRLNNSPSFGAADPTGRADVVPGSIVIHSVRGVSVRARVAWRQGNRWRRLENSTYLTRQGA